MSQKKFIIDFDSTFIKVETLDVLAQVSLSDDPEFQDKINKIKGITDICMNGGMSFKESLSSRLSLLNAHKSHFPKLISELKKQVSKSVISNIDFFMENRENIYIISSGFKICITPVVEEFGVKTSHVFANDFHFDK